MVELKEEKVLQGQQTTQGQQAKKTNCVQITQTNGKYFIKKATTCNVNTDKSTITTELKDPVLLKVSQGEGGLQVEKQSELSPKKIIEYYNYLENLKKTILYSSGGNAQFLRPHFLQKEPMIYNKILMIGACQDFAYDTYSPNYKFDKNILDSEFINYTSIDKINVKDTITKIKQFLINNQPAIINKYNSEKDILATEVKTQTIKATKKEINLYDDYFEYLLIKNFDNNFDDNIKLIHDAWALKTYYELYNDDKTFKAANLFSNEDRINQFKKFDDLSFEEQLKDIVSYVCLLYVDTNYTKLIKEAEAKQKQPQKQPQKGGKKSKNLPYEKRTVAQLQSLAKSRKIKCPASLKKAELIKLIRKS